MRLVEAPVGLEHLLNGTTNDNKEDRMKVTMANRKIYEERVRFLLARQRQAA
jgi:hypothetical protein